MNYKKEFKNALEFAEANNLYLGSGNPNGKILVIGKEHYYDHKSELNSDDFYKEILEVRENDIHKNLSSWRNNITESFSPHWNDDLDSTIINSNPFTIYWNQKNKNNRIVNGVGNGGTSNTYVNYQKIYQNVFLNGVKEETINFQKEFFLSELNDLPSKKSFNFQRLNDLRKSLIEERKELFKNEFFRGFPITIIASGHYPSQHNFDIEKIFNVKWTEETINVGNSWYNLHYSNDKKRILIHTRQLSTSVSSELIDSISQIILNFMNSIK